MNFFRGQNLLEFSEHFKTDLNCKEYLSQIKWNNGCQCRKCRNETFQTRKDFSRTCNKCSDTESPKKCTNSILELVRYLVQ